LQKRYTGLSTNEPNVKLFLASVCLIALPP
jgi:hypothetical protein